MANDEAGEVAFKVAFADLVFQWNHLESTTRYLAQSMSGTSGYVGQILTSHIPNQTLENALKALSQRYDDILVEHVAHFCKGFSIIRDWRNHYVHGIFRMAEMDGSACGYVSSVGISKGRLGVHQAPVQTHEVVAITGHAEVFHRYVSAIIGHVFNAHGNNLFAYTPLAQLEKPPLPPSCERSRIYFSSDERFAAPSS